MDDSARTAQIMYELASRDSGTALDAGLVERFADLIRQRHATPPQRENGGAMQDAAMPKPMRNRGLEGAREDAIASMRPITAECSAAPAGVREAFEPWFAGRFRALNIDRRPDGEYAYGTAQTAWEGTQFGATWAQRQVAPDGYVLVPREPTEEMCSEALDEHAQRSTDPEKNKEMMEVHAATYRAMLSATPIPHAEKAGLSEEERRAIMAAERFLARHPYPHSDERLLSDLLAIVDRLTKEPKP